LWKPTSFTQRKAEFERPKKGRDLKTTAVEEQGMHTEGSPETWDVFMFPRRNTVGEAVTRITPVRRKRRFTSSGANRKRAVEPREANTISLSMGRT
jgi:hypothetical protein